MTTWTPKTQQAETWTAEAPGLHMFSSLVFSPASHNGLHVFALGYAQVEGWYRKTVDTETWTPA